MKSYNFQSIVDRLSVSDTGCWLMTGKLNPKGYARVKYKGQTWTGHRFIYSACSNEDIVGKELHHVCENKGCVNPKHLLPLTRREHWDVTFKGSPRINSLKEYCKRGHKFDTHNTYIRCDGSRICRVCLSARRRIRTIRDRERRNAP
jgi:hypothetical protein